MFLTRSLLLLAVLASSLFGQVTFTQQDPIAADATNIYVVWYGPWSDAVQQNAIIDLLTNSINQLPDLTISKYYPVGLRKQYTLTNVQFTLAAQINQAYSTRYNGGVVNGFAQGSSGEELLVGDLLTAATIPAPSLSKGGEGTNTYVLVFLGQGITSNAAGSCAYTTIASPANNYMVSVIEDQTNLGQSCQGYTLPNKVSGSAASDAAIFGMMAEILHGIQGISWQRTGSSISELCLNTFENVLTAPSGSCSSGADCLYTAKTNTGGGDRYYYLPDVYVNAPPGSSGARCAYSYTPPAAALSLLARRKGMD